MKTNKTNDFDTLTLYVKKLKANEIIEYYKTFGWVLENETENKKYEDLIDLTLKRPHQIENKDELQLMQVYMEEKVNKIGKIEHHKHSKTTAFCLFFGVIGLFMLIVGVFSLLNIIKDVNFIVSIVFSVIGSVFSLLTAICTPIIYKKELLNFQITHKNLSKELKQILDKASLLVGGGNNE